MRSGSRAVASALAVLMVQVFCGLALLAAESPKSHGPTAIASGSGRLTGVVIDAAGAPMESILVTLTGPAGVSLAVCDADGRFEFRALPPGTYLLRTHAPGLEAEQRSVVEVRPGAATVYSVTLRPSAAASPPPVFLAAGFGGLSSLVDAPDDLGGSGAPDDVSPPAELGERVDETDAFGPHDDSEKAWRLRRARRSVLKDSSVKHVLRGDDGEGAIVSITPRLAADRTMSGAPTDFPVSGQFHLLSRATVDSASELRSTEILPGQIAYASLGGPEQGSRWGLSGGMRTGDAGSWVLSGTYMAEPTATHALAVGMSYSRQRVQGQVGTESLIPSAAILEDARLPDFSREVGSVSVQGTWEASSHVRLEYGTNIARYGYLPEVSLVSPNAVVTIEPSRRTRLRIGVAQNMLAPGAEEFSPPVDGVWLPPERTFAVPSSADVLNSERSQQFEVALERDLGLRSTVGIRRFYQEVDDQMVAMFGIGPATLVSASNRYYLTSASGVSAQGWGLMFSHVVAGRVRGAVDYTVTEAEWAPTGNRVSPEMVGVFRTGSERFHDVTTSVETEIPETETEVVVLYRINSAFAVVDSDTARLAPGLDGRFALRVRQALPFSPVEGSEWEVLVDIRSLFREPVAGASVYDELLVASPPKQVVGGLVVHF